MTAATPYRSSVPGGRDGFARLVLAEWIKLASVPGWMLTLAAAAVLTVVVAVLTAAGAAETEDGGGTQGVPVQYRDEGHVVHQPLTGDGTVVARVAAQEGSHEWAKAGLMLTEDTRPGSPYAAVMVTPEHGVRLQADFTTDVAGSAAAAPRWLKLTRSGTSVTAHESPDGEDWSTIGTVELDGLPPTVQVGLFVASPDTQEVGRTFGGEEIHEEATDAEAAFDNVSVEPAQPQEPQPWRDRDRSREPAGSTEEGGTFTLTGSGDIGQYEYGTDATQTALSGALVGAAAIVALAVLFLTSEYERGTIWTTFAASPRRGRVLAAKAVVIGAAASAAGLAASFGAVLLSAPLLRANGVTPASLADPAVLRAVVGTAALLGVAAVFSLGVAAAVRRAAPAITAVLLLLLAPQVLATGLPLPAAMWLERLTPAAGFAISQTVPRYDTAIGPWAGFGVLCAYTAAALAAALWRLRRHDA